MVSWQQLPGGSTNHCEKPENGGNIEHRLHQNTKNIAPTTRTILFIKNVV